MDGKYFSWNIRDGVACTGDIILPVVESKKDVLYEGNWGIISEKHTTAISGVCLLDTRWCVKFTTGAIRSVALPLDRMRVEDRIKKGFVVESVFFPVELSAYHKKLIDYVSDTVTLREPSKLLFHIPTEEYKQYISALEALMKKEIPGAYGIVESFSEKVRQYFVEKMCGIGFKNYQFIEPMKISAANPEESYQLPYVHPEIFGVQGDEIYAIEDLVEIKIALQVEKMYGRHIPVTYCVIDIPHPYAIYDKEAILSGECVDIVSI